MSASFRGLLAAGLLMAGWAPFASAQVRPRSRVFRPDIQRSFTFRRELLNPETIRLRALDRVRVRIEQARVRRFERTDVLQRRLMQDRLRSRPFEGRMMLRQRPFIGRNWMRPLVRRRVGRI